jgi:hypothetical protein
LPAEHALPELNAGIAPALAADPYGEARPALELLD